MQRRRNEGIYSYFHNGRHFSLHEHDVKICERDMSMVIATFLIGSIHFWGQPSKDDRFVEYKVPFIQKSR